MRVIPLSLALLLWVALPDQPRAASPLVRAPARIILDTDMSGDCDDAGALALLHALADRGECELLATVVNRKDRTGASAAAIDAINTFYGRPKLPIGTDKRGPTALQRTSAFARALRDEFFNDIGPDEHTPDALEVYREVLAAQPDGSVVICSVGALSNLAELWRQAPELVRQKVRQLVVMGGRFPKSQQPETNVATHREAAQLVAAEWPGEIVWHGWEVGNALFTGAALKQVPGKNPVRRAYELKPFGKRPAIEGGQPSWDQGAALFAVRGAQPELWDVVAGGRVRVDGQGNTAWQTEHKGCHSYVKIQGDPKKLATVIEDLMIQPPKQSVAAGPPVRIFCDTDMHTDCDDAGALAILHALADRGECEILATVVSVKDPLSAATVDAINTYHGRPSLPLGMVKGAGVLRKSNFTHRLAADFIHRVKSAEDVPDAAEVYRDVLAQQPDGSVVIVTVGYLTNLRNLLRLPATNGHPSGRELIKRKVTKWVCMGGNFVGHPPKDDLKLGNVNFQQDAGATLETIAHWPGPIVFVGREIGSVPSGLQVGANLAKTPPENPVRMAYFHYFGGQQKSRHAADLTTVLYAVRGLRDYWDLSPPGRMNLQPDTKFEWQSTTEGNQSFLLKKLRDGKPNDRYLESVLDELLLQPPRRRASAGSSALAVPATRITLAPAAPPYPPSPIIAAMDWAPTNKIVRAARDGDNWPLTWADDDALYTAWGDGTGFDPKVEKKLSLGFARVTGAPDNFIGVNVRSQTEQLGQGRAGKKGWGMLCVEGVLNLWLGHPDNHGATAQLAWSRDHAKTWTVADWKFAEFGLMGFVNFGQNYSGARDGFAYAYSHDDPSALRRRHALSPVRHHLLRLGASDARASGPPLSYLHIECPPQAISHSQPHYTALRVSGQDCWVRDVVCDETMNSIAVSGQRITLTGVAVNREARHQGSSRPAEFAPNGGQVLLDRCSVNADNLWFVAIGGRQAGPIVLLHCTFLGDSRAESHQRWSTGMLDDNCRAPAGGIECRNRGSMGSGHGWSMGWGVAWNCVAKDYVIQNPPGAANWMIGCLGESTLKPRPFGTGPMLAEGIKDSPGKPVTPQSLYLAQLAERLGPQAVKNIGY